MSKHEKDGLEACLFSRQGAKLVNIKFFRGPKEIISTDDMHCQIRAIADQHAKGLEPAAGPSLSDKSVINVRKLVASM